MASPRSSSPPPVETSRLWEEFVNTNRTLYRRHRELGEPTYPFDQGTDYRRTWPDLVHAHQRVFLSHRESSSTLSSPSGADPEFPESTTLSPQIPPTREPSPSGMAEHGTEGTDCGNVGRIPNLKKSLSTTKVPYNWQRTRSFTSVPSISVFGSTSSEMPAKERLSRRHTYQRPTDIMTKNLPRETHWKHAHGLGLVSLDSGEASGETETGGGKRLKRFKEVLSFLHLSFFGGCTLSPMSAVFPMRVFYTVMSFTRHPRIFCFGSTVISFLYHCRLLHIGFSSLLFSAALPYEGKCQTYGSRPVQAQRGRRAQMRPESIGWRRWQIATGDESSRHLLPPMGSRRVADR